MLVHKRLSKKDVFCRECLAPILLSNFVKQPHQKFAFSFCNLFTEVKRTLTSNTVFGDKTLVTLPPSQKEEREKKYSSSDTKCCPHPDPTMGTSKHIFLL
jgi:hypothetical protein